MAKTQQEFITLKVGDASQMRSFVSRPEGQAPKAAVIVIQEVFGVNAHIREVAQKFAAEGYLAIAPECFHRTAPAGWEGSYTNFAEAAPHMQAYTFDQSKLDMEAAFAWLKTELKSDEPRIAAAGFCLGGRLAYVANAFLPLKAAISFYGGRIAPDHVNLAASQHGPVLFFWGGLDTHIPADARRSITDALASAKKKYVNVEFSLSDHGFFCDHRKSYDPVAAQEAWALTQSFLAQNLGG